MGIEKQSETVYKPQQVRAYQGIPTIEALPLIMSEDAVINKLTNLPDYNNSERNDPTEVRRHTLVSSLTKLFYQPLEEHLLIEQMLSQIIRQSSLDKDGEE